MATANEKCYIFRKSSEKNVTILPLLQFSFSYNAKNATRVRLFQCDRKINVYNYTLYESRDISTKSKCKNDKISNDTAAISGFLARLQPFSFNIY